LPILATPARGIHKFAPIKAALSYSDTAVRCFGSRLGFRLVWQ
jgi:hypothetical protein